MDAVSMLQLALDPTLILKAQGIEADPWQRALLLSTDKEVALNCSRQAGKSTTVAALVLHVALFNPNALILILSPGLRQSGEFFRKVKDAYNAIGRPLGTMAENQSTLEIPNGSRIVCLPGKEATVRSYSKVALLVVDEAARVPDDLYKAIRPMLAVSQGRIILLSTPFGQRGFFFKTWHSDSHSWKRIKITWQQCPRITQDFINNELKELGEPWVNQEYNCEFTAMEGLVYPQLLDCVVDCVTLPQKTDKRVGGIDYGWNDPFAAVWGFLRDDVLYINEERYLRQTPIHEHAKALPKHHLWHADPSGPAYAAELRVADHKILKGFNDIRLGIAAVTARIRTNRLKISANCQNLIQEAQLYRYPTQQEKAIVGEKPIDDNNHAMDALRYLVAGIDRKFIAKIRKLVPKDGPPEPPANPTSHTLEEQLKSIHNVDVWLSTHNDQLFTKL